MKLKKLETPINCCEYCTHAGSEYCWHPSFADGQEIPDKRLIPDFCPLPDWEVKEEHQ